MAQALLGPGLRQDSSRDFSVVEREYFGPDDLMRLVALARYNHRIKSLGPAEGRPNRGRPVGFGGVAVGRHPRSAHTGDDLVDNRLRALRARVVRGHPYAVAQASGDLAHDRPLAAVAVAPAAEDGAEARARPPPPADRRGGPGRPGPAWATRPAARRAGAWRAGRTRGSRGSPDGPA